MKAKIMTMPHVLLAASVLSVTAAPRLASADEVSDWNQNMLTAAAAAKLGPGPTSRVAAMVQSAVFDAINGVHKRYSPVHVDPAAPPGTSARAAAAQAAHDILVDLFPGQRTTLDAQLLASIAQLVEEDDDSLGRSVERGLAWGQYVASQIWAWRSTDGFTTVLPPPPPLPPAPASRWGTAVWHRWPSAPRPGGRRWGQGGGWG